MSDMKLADFDIVLVGCGQMGRALVGGAVASGVVAPGHIRLLDANASAAEAFAAEIGAKIGYDRTDRPNLWILAVKPRDMKDAVRACEFERGDLLVSVAAGVTLAQLADWSDDVPTIVRTMPNTPALVGAGVTGVIVDSTTEEPAIDTLFESVGTVVHLSHEDEFDALTGISGSGPAYVFTAIEALADGGVAMGLKRDAAIQLAIATLEGAATLARQSNAHTAELKDRVASPGGTTIAALNALESNGFRHALIEAVRAAATRSRELGE
jgi:pyrroline-5-carboxylate reductase